jgi:hypothetical protein
MGKDAVPACLSSLHLMRIGSSIEVTSEVQDVRACLEDVRAPAGLLCTTPGSVLFLRPHDTCFVLHVGPGHPLGSSIKL